MSLRAIGFVLGVLHRHHADQGEVIQYFSEAKLLTGEFFRQMTKIDAHSDVVRVAAFETLKDVCQAAPGFVAIGLVAHGAADDEKKGAKNVFQNIAFLQAPLERAAVLPAAIESVMAFTFATRDYFVPVRPHFLSIRLLLSHPHYFVDSLLQLNAQKQFFATFCKKTLRTAMMDMASQAASAVAVCSSILPLLSVLLSSRSESVWQNSLGEISAPMLKALWALVAGSVNPADAGSKLSERVFGAVLRAYCDSLFFFLHRAHVQRGGSTLFSELGESVGGLLALLFSMQQDVTRASSVSVLCQALARHDDPEHELCGVVEVVSDHLRLLVGSSAPRIPDGIRVISVETQRSSMPGVSATLAQIFEVQIESALSDVGQRDQDPLLCSLLIGVPCVRPESTAGDGECQWCSSFTRFGGLLEDRARNASDIALAARLLFQFAEHGTTCKSNPTLAAREFASFTEAMCDSARGEPFNTLSRLRNGFAFASQGSREAMSLLVSDCKLLQTILLEGISSSNSTPSEDELRCYQLLLQDSGWGLNLFPSHSDTLDAITSRLVDVLQVARAYNPDEGFEDIIQCSIAACSCAPRDVPVRSSVDLCARLGAVCVFSHATTVPQVLPLVRAFFDAQLDPAMCATQVADCLRSFCRSFAQYPEAKYAKRLHQLGQSLFKLLPASMFYDTVGLTGRWSDDFYSLGPLLSLLRLSGQRGPVGAGTLQNVPLEEVTVPLDHSELGLVWVGAMCMLDGVLGNVPFDAVPSAATGLSNIICDLGLRSRLLTSDIEFVDPKLNAILDVALRPWSFSRYGLWKRVADAREVCVDTILAVCASCLRPAGHAIEPGAVLLREILDDYQSIGETALVAGSIRRALDIHGAELLSPNFVLALQAIPFEEHDTSVQAMLKQRSMDVQQALDESITSSPVARLAADFVFWCVLAEVIASGSTGEPPRGLSTFCEKYSKQFVNRLGGEQEIGAPELIALGVACTTSQRFAENPIRVAESFRDFPVLWQKFLGGSACDGSDSRLCVATSLGESTARSLLEVWAAAGSTNVSIDFVKVSHNAMIRNSRQSHFLEMHLWGHLPLLLGEDLMSTTSSGEELASRLVDPFASEAPDGFYLSSCVFARMLESLPASDQRGIAAIQRAIDDYIVAAQSKKKGEDMTDAAEFQFILWWYVVLTQKSDSVSQFVRESPAEADSRFEVPRINTVLDALLRRLEATKTFSARPATSSAPAGLEDYLDLSRTCQWSVPTLLVDASKALDGEPSTRSELTRFVVERLTLWVFVQCLRTFPVQFRMWFVDSVRNRQTAQQLRLFIEQNISPSVILEELSRVSAVAADPDRLSELLTQTAGHAGEASNSDAEFSLFVARSGSSSSSASVSAQYELEDTDLSFTLEIPPCFPLDAVPAPVSSSGTGVTAAKWRSWMLGVTALLATNEASLLEAMLRWKVSMDSHFNGVESCPICYSVFHVSDKSLPSLPCRTCKNKFHSSCMYKWVRVSRNNTCPMCRTPFG
jgi:Ubiquitin conjugating domain-like/Ring finger domain/LTN1 family HEAT repeat region